MWRAPNARVSAPARLTSLLKSTINFTCSGRARASSISALLRAAGAKLRLRRVGASGRVVALDILDMKPIAGVEFLKLDFLDQAVLERLKAILGGKADVVLSDMAANATGHRQTDHLRVMALAHAAAHFAREVLGPRGSFLCKVLQGGTEATLLAALKRDFSSVKHIKPPASRSDSAELYLLVSGFRGGGAGTSESESAD